MKLENLGLISCFCAVIIVGYQILTKITGQESVWKNIVMSDVFSSNFVSTIPVLNSNVPIYMFLFGLGALCFVICALSKNY